MSAECEALVRIRSRTAAPVIMLSARASEDDRVRGLLAGADDYLGRSMSPAEVTARVAAVLRRSPRKHDNVFDDGIVQMDAANANVVVHDEQIALTPLELRLLGALTEHPGRVVTPEQLGHLVWGRLSPSTADNARLYVSYLRAKIERDPSNPQLIETVRGRGYRYTGMALGSAAPGGASLTLPAFTESAPTAARARAGV